MCGDGSGVDHQRRRRGKVERPSEIGHRVGGGAGTHQQARSVGSGRFARRDDRMLHAGTVGGNTTEGESEPPEPDMGADLVL